MQQSTKLTKVGRNNRKIAPESDQFSLGNFFDQEQRNSFFRILLEDDVDLIQKLHKERFITSTVEETESVVPVLDSTVPIVGQNEWQQLLMSRDLAFVVEPKCKCIRSCDSDLCLSGQHIDIGTVFLLPFIMGSKKCAAYFIDTFGDYSYLITERGCNILHVTVIGAFYKIKSEVEYLDLLRTVVAPRFNGIPLREMSRQENSYSMRPTELAAVSGLLKMSQELLSISDLHITHNKISGLYERQMVNLDEYDMLHPNSRFFRCPMVLLLLGDINYQEIAKSRVFRDPFIIQAWCDSLYKRNKPIYVGFIIERFFMLAFLMVFGMNGIFRYVALTCLNYNTLDHLEELREASLERFLSRVFTCWNTSINAFQIVTSIVLILYMEHYYRSLRGFPGSMKYRKLYFIYLGYITPSILQVFLGIYYLLSDAYMASLCQSIGLPTIKVQTALCMIAVVLTTLYQAANTLQGISGVGKFIINFFQSFTLFINFIFIYSVAILIFSRIFQSLSMSSESSTLKLLNKTTADGLRNMSNSMEVFENYDTSTYSTFRLSLNIADFQLKDVTYDVWILHAVYIFLIPSMFFNFIIGMISQRVSEVGQIDTEILMLLRVSWNVFMEAVRHPVKLFFCRLCCRNSKDPPYKWRVTICRSIGITSIDMFTARKEICLETSKTVQNEK